MTRRQFLGGHAAKLLAGSESGPIPHLTMTLRRRTHFVSVCGAVSWLA